MSAAGKLTELVARARTAFNSGRTRPLEWRQQQLRALLNLLDENEDVLCDCLKEDLRKPRQEAIMFEIEFMRNDIRGCLNNIASWVTDQSVEKNIVTLLDRTELHYEPLGVVLVMGAWNYPIQLCLGPVGGAIAAGNCVIIKPSELAPATARTLASLLPRYLDPDCCQVVEGGVETTQQLLTNRFDYIFFTGSGPVGKLVRAAANNHLTPVTLELGGKSPVWVDNTADFAITARRLVWAKFINLGQTCIAPDYVLCTAAVRDRLVRAVVTVLEQWYGQDPQASPHLCRIVNTRHWDRLDSLLSSSKGRVVVGAEQERDRADLFIPPTLVTDLTGEDALMEGEIFGPILPILAVRDMEEAIQFIVAREKPLTLYMFSSDRAAQQRMKEATSSGSMVVNDAVVHLSVETLPFGGVGASGMGAYHGRYTFTTFSHMKSILVRDFSKLGEYLGETRYPPYEQWKWRRMAFLLKNRKLPSLSWLSSIAWFLLGAGAAAALRAVLDTYGLFQQ